MTSTGQSVKAAPRRSRLRRITGNPLVHLVAAFLVLALVQAFLVKLYYVPSGSMEQTLETGDRILVNRLAFTGSEPTTGDVVVFNASAAWDGEGAEPSSNPLSAAYHWVAGALGIGPSGDHTLVKRVIAGPGDTVSCCDAEGRVMVNGVPIEEPYVFEDLPFEAGTLDCDSAATSSRCFDEFIVPDDRYFLLGDHRSLSNDSLGACRGLPGPIDDCVKLVTRSDIVGRVFQIVLPFGRWGPI
ncbi:signal peptidase I [Herbiconiux sp. CPCC 205763]|uniref:Signal peptidase I n=1 Tax=Herbiconiux aconitum TaxID=2970913 RepID=A0ABT2GPS9_9MICO|nr:signal peptidase I [Herbiconiux aconitum]MCS5716776.1 signal peptidase I [Herbiconiux aconitum]